MQEEKEKAQELISEVATTKIKDPMKKKYKVVIYCPKYTIYDDGMGNNVKIMGDYGVEQGRYLEV